MPLSRPWLKRFTYVERAWQLKNSPEEATVPWRIQQVIDKVSKRAEEKGFSARVGRSFMAADDWLVHPV